MKATELLQKQHREIEQLLERLRISGPEDAAAIRDELASLLVAHTKIEEEHFYPALRDVAPERIREAVEEHGLADYELARDLGAHPADEDARARTAVLADLVLSHIRKEESDVFRRAESALTGPELAMIGEAMAKTYELVRRQDYRAILARALAENAPQLMSTRRPYAKAKSARRGPAKAKARQAAGSKRPATAKRAAAKRGTAKRGTAKRGAAKRAAAKRPTAKRSAAPKRAAATQRATTAKRAVASQRATAKRGAAAKRATAKRGTARKAAARRAAAPPQATQATSAARRSRRVAVSPR
jgi:hypothetical protein